MFSDIENEEMMKKTRSDRHKRYLSDFETYNSKENDYDSEKEITNKPTNVALDCENRNILTEIQSNEYSEKHARSHLVYGFMIQIAVAMILVALRQ